MKRDIQGFPPYQIAKCGTVYLKGKRVSPEIRPGPYQDRLTVQVGHTWIPVEQLISEVWYENDPVLVPRNGVSVDFTERNIFPLWKFPKLLGISRESLLWSWTQYQLHEVPVSRLAEATGIPQWSSTDFTALISSILIASIRK
jgi:hypothetical protein